MRSVERALAIVEVLAANREALGVSDVAKRVRLSASTVHRLLSTLTQRGWVEHDEATGQYRIGHGVLGTAAVALAHSRLVTFGRPAIEQISKHTGRPAHISVLVDLRVVYLAQSNPVSRWTEFHPGIRQPAHCTSAGKMLLACQPPSRLEMLLASAPALRAYTDLTITTVPELIEELSRVRNDGHAVDRGEFTQEWRSVSVPVFGRGGEVLAALSFGAMAPDGLDDLLTHVGLATAAARELSQQLGNPA